MNTKHFFAGQEEILARLSSLLITGIFFVIYTFAKTSITLDWQTIILLLGIFWFIYEFVAVVLFQFFNFFSAKNDAIQLPKETPNRIDEEPKINL